MSTVAQHQAQRISLPRRPFPLTGGDSLPEVQVAVRTWGHYDANANRGAGNAVLICHALTGDQDPTTWWPGVVGVGRAIDPKLHFIIGQNVLGGCQGTTGPLSIDPASGRPWGLTFPSVQVADMVAVQADLLEQLGVSHLWLVAGGSLGGMQALAWAMLHPGRLEHALVACAPWASPPMAIAWNEIGRQAILLDPDFANGSDPSGQRAGRGLSVARMLAMTTYRSHQDLHQRFGRDMLDSATDPVFARSGPYATELPRTFRFAPHYQVESYLHYQGEKLRRRFDAFSYLYLTAAMDGFDGAQLTVGQLTGPLPRVHVLGVDSDLLYPEPSVREVCLQLGALGYPASYQQLKSASGHDAFLLEGALVGREIDALLQDRTLPAAASLAAAAHGRSAGGR